MVVAHRIGITPFDPASGEARRHTPSMTPAGGAESSSYGRLRYATCMCGRFAIYSQSPEISHRLGLPEPESGWPLATTSCLARGFPARTTLILRAACPWASSGGGIGLTGPPVKLRSQSTPKWKAWPPSAPVGNRGG